MNVSSPAAGSPGTGVLTPELRIILALGFGMFFLAELAALLGLARSPIMQLASATSVLAIAVPLYTLMPHYLLMYIAQGPRRRELIPVIGTGLAIAAVLYWSVPVSSRPSQFWFVAVVLGGGLGASSFVALAMRARHEMPAKRLMIASIFVVLLALYAYSYLDVTAALHPVTYDAVAYRIDLTYGFDPSVAVAAMASHWPLFERVLTAAYYLLPYACSGIFALQLMQPRKQPVDFFVVWSVGTAIAMIVAYQLCPVSGPKYAFGDTVFPGYMPSAQSLQLAPSLIAPSPRNGIPSMHFGWALLIWINACWLPAGKVASVVRSLAAAALGLTVLATLGLGEHYLIDLVIAVPFIVAIQALCFRSLPWQSSAKWQSIAGGGGMTLFWILLVRFAPEVFLVPGFTWVLTIATVVASIMLYRPLEREALAFSQRAEQTAADPAALTQAALRVRLELRQVVLMFVVSGFAGLMYQVLFSKALALTFGSTSTATYTVLATYMGGMALGAWLGGYLAARRSDPLKVYAGCEFAIAAYCVLTPLIFSGIQSLYVVLASGFTPDAGVLTVFRVLLGMVALMVPTVLMGMTLPVLARYFEQRAQTLGRTVAMLYGANTLGAALGALLTGYLILPAVGVLGTTFLAAAANLLAVVLAVNLAKQAGGWTPMDLPVQPLSSTAGPSDLRLGRVALLLLTVGGAITLALEVNYIHLLAVVAGNSVYAFSLMLFAFLIGLGAGSECARHLLRLRVPLPAALAWGQFGLAAVILLGVYLWDNLPDYFASFESYPLTRDFAAREVVRGVVCWIAMFPPAFAIGLLYPIAMECVGRAWPDRPVQALGRAAALNTLGNIAGVLVGGFYLLPLLGALRSVQILAAVCLVLGVIVLVFWPQPAGVAVPRMIQRDIAWTPATLVLILLVMQPSYFNYSAIASGANVYFARQGWGQTIDHAESVDGGLTSVSMLRTPEGGKMLTLLTNGKFQGNDAMQGEMMAQVGLALAPLLHTQQRERALVIGFGTGVSARTLHEAGFRETDIVDLSADIIRLATEHFGKVNGNVTKQPGVNTYVTDGRNFLMLQDRKYDVVSMEVSSIWFAGAASLYNREFYQLVKRRLSPQGVLQQWMQIHRLAPTDLLYIMGSLRAEFRHVWLYIVGGQGMLIATNDAAAAPSLANAAVLDAEPGLKDLIKFVGGSAKSLLGMQLLDPSALDRVLGSTGAPASYWISTDNNLQLEYSTPRANVRNALTSMRQNIEFLASRAQPASPGAAAKPSAPTTSP